MRTIIEFVERENDLPLLRLYIHHAPHRRQHHSAIIGVYRKELVAAAKAAGIPIPINRPVALSALFIEPSSPDLDNLVMALFRAMDGHLIKDDGLIYALEKVAKFYPETKK